MAKISRKRQGSAATARRLSFSDVRLSDTDRLEMFSDGVLSITITFLVFDIVRPEYAAGHLLPRLREQWPNYIAFLASFFYIGIIWLNHRAVFSRVCYCSRSLHLANLLLLLTSALIPFPTAVLSTALRHGSRADATVAVELYAVIGCPMCLSGLLLFQILSVNPHLLETHVDRSFFPRERHRALLGVALYILAGIIGWALSPTLALINFLALPTFYGITSEGLVETRVALLSRLNASRRSRGAPDQGEVPEPGKTNIFSGGGDRQNRELERDDPKSSRSRSAGAG